MGLLDNARNLCLDRSKGHSELDSVKNEPSGRLADSQLFPEFDRGDACLCSGDEPNRVKPCEKRKFRVLDECAVAHSEGSAAPRTLVVFPRLAGVTPHAAATRTDWFAVPADLFEEGDASFFGSEAALERDDGNLHVIGWNDGSTLI